MQGILVMDKPAGFTSFDVDAKLRGICRTRRIGHAGTLDPMATGVLPVFVGAAARAVDLQQDHDKTYEAVLRLGMRTDTGDITGTVLETAPVPASVDAAAVAAVLPRFTGRSEQLPPMYSAVKVNGQPLYKAARAGRAVERKARPIEIYSLELLDADGCGAHEYRLRIACSKGTYVRVLAEDIGAALGVPAVLAALRRTRAGAYTLAAAHTFAEVEAARAAGTLQSLFLSVDTVFSHLPAVRMDADTCARLLHGAPSYRFPARDGEYRLYLDAQARAQLQAAAEAAGGEKAGAAADAAGGSDRTGETGEAGETGKSGETGVPAEAKASAEAKAPAEADISAAPDAVQTILSLLAELPAGGFLGVGRVQHGVLSASKLFVERKRETP